MKAVKKMDAKSLEVLEYNKILEQLAGYCAFPVSAEKARQLTPLHDISTVQHMQAETREVVELLSMHSDLTIGGARDIRSLVGLAERGAALSPQDLLDVKYTLVAARDLRRKFDRLSNKFPHLQQLADQIPPAPGIIDAISRAISERGEILDSASAELGSIRRNMRIAHDRVISSLQKIVSTSKNSAIWQDNLITQRDGRYVLPLRSEFRGRIKAIVHDQSSSGATLFVEPLSVVALNNQYRELQLAERDELQRILLALSQQVGAKAEMLQKVVDQVAYLDFALARGKYAIDLKAFEPQFHSIKPNKTKLHPGSIIRLFKARHPLLDQKTVVPIDVELDAQTYALVITGPNTGGKTVTLKTVGLLILMAQSGLHIPAQQGSEISIFSNLFADIGDEQSIEQSLSTFSGHITNIIRILQKADRRSLVLLDELGAGTDPQEGAALARALLTHLLNAGITTLVTTHHPELKAFAHAAPGVVNASVEFDLKTLRPTYRLSIGLPGRSNALDIAARLGLPREIIDYARNDLNPADLHAEDLLDEIHHQRDAARQARQAAEQARQEAQDLRLELAERLEQIEDERREVLENARQEAETKLQELDDELQAVRKALSRARQPLDVIDSVEQKVENIGAVIEHPTERRRPSIPGTIPRRPLRLGDKVRLHTLNTQGILTSLGEDEAEIQVGILRVKARLSDIELASSPAETIPTQQQASFPISAKRPSTEPAGELYHTSPGIELDIRGLRVDEGIEKLDRYLDSAYLAGLPFVRIIHGKGTGKLRTAVRDALQGHPHVRSYERGKEQEGGDGVTVAKLHT